MNYPLISEYVEAIKSAEDDFATLTNLRPVLDGDGNPVMTSGNFAVVFKMKDEENGKLYAVKCFLKDQPNRAESYKMIADELEYVSSTFLVQFRYLDKELFVDTNNSDEDEFPVLLMDWVEGVILDKYIRKNIDDQYALQMLAYRFSKLAMWIIPQPFAHGDIKPDNIMVREDGALVLIDYDGMYVPAMKGQKARELGSPDFCHPSRTVDDFDEHIDDFSLVSILLSLRVIANDSSLLEKYGAADCLLFSEKDYCDISTCQLLKELYPSPDNEINTLISLFTIALTHGNLSKESFRLLTLKRPDEPEILSTEVTKEDLANAWTDEYGVRYSNDGKKAIKCTKSFNGLDYKIKDGVIIICDEAFQDRKLHSIVLPETIKCIGKSAFAENNDLEYCNIPKSVSHINMNPWQGCFNIKHFDCESPNFIIKDGILYSFDYKVAYGFIYWNSKVKINKRTKIIAENAFRSSKRSKDQIIKSVDLSQIDIIGKNAFFGCSAIQKVVIPNSVSYIGDNSFYGCKALQSIIIPQSVTSIEKGTFKYCSALNKVIIPKSITKIEEDAFYGCESLNSIVIPDSVTSIGREAFSRCSSLESIIIPNSVISINYGSFSNCKSLKQISIPKSLKKIDLSLFKGCTSLKSITLPNSITSIGNSAFSGCSSLESIVIPNSVISIGNYSFSRCSSLHSIIIPDSVTFIGKSAFEFCSTLQSVSISNSVSSLNDRTFLGCSSLRSILIPNSVISIGMHTFSGCTKLQGITISNRLESIGDGAFGAIYYQDRYLFKEYGIDDWKLVAEACVSLKSIVLPIGIKEIGNNAFDECTSLKSVNIPSSILSMGYGVFDDCSSLETIEVSYKTFIRLKKHLQEYSNIIKYI